MEDRKEAIRKEADRLLPEQRENGIAVHLVVHFLVFQIKNAQDGAVNHVIVRREISGFRNTLQKVSVQHIVLSFSIKSLLDTKVRRQQLIHIIYHIKSRPFLQDAHIFNCTAL